MAIKSTPTRVELSGDDALKFLQQVKDGPSPEQQQRASELLRRGRVILVSNLMGKLESGLRKRSERFGYIPHADYTAPERYTE